MWRINADALNYSNVLAFLFSFLIDNCIEAQDLIKVHKQDPRPSLTRARRVIRQKSLTSVQKTAAHTTATFCVLSL